jgi:hypothetical protein
MDVRTLAVSLGFVAALLGGAAVGWLQGNPPIDSAAASADEGLTATPMESASSPPTVVDEAVPQPVYEPYAGDIFGIGDSVLAGAARCLADRGFDVDVQQSRRASQAIGILTNRIDWLPPRIIIHLGTNGGATPAELDAIMALLGPDRLVMWSTIQLPDDPARYTYERKTNKAIADLAERYDNVLVFDWEAKSQQHPSWIYLEGIHMTPEGCRGYASLVDPQLRAPSPYGNG